jgi:hypothetical protein
LAESEVKEVSQIVTPAQVEQQLYALSKEIDTNYSELLEAESHYSSDKAQYEIAMARSRMEYSMKSSPTGKNYTVSEREDMALLTNETLHLQMAMSEARVKAARANAVRIKTKVDIARSIGTSVRAAVEIS